MGLNIATLLSIPKGCVFALVNIDGKLVFINYSTETLGYIVRIVKEMLDGTHASKKMTRDIKALEIRILSTTDDVETLKMHTQYWRDQYVLMGFAPYMTQKVPLQYVCKVKPSDDLKSIHVVLVNRRNESKVVGVFVNVEDAHEFKNVCYNDVVNKYRLPVFALNSRTREYVGAVSSKVRW